MTANTATKPTPPALLRLAAAPLLVFALAASAGCPKRGENLLKQDAEIIARAEAREAERAAERGETPDSLKAPTTQPAAVERAQLVELTIAGEEIEPASLELAPGLYRFKIANTNKARPNYFYLRRANGSADGETIFLEQVNEESEKTFALTLDEPGNYYYSAPFPANAKRFRLVVRAPRSSSPPSE